MKSKSQKIRSMFFATSMMFAMLAIGVQPMLLGSGRACDCSTIESVNERNTEASCCNGENEELLSSCCSSRLATAQRCSCKPTSVCDCADCGCSDGNEEHLPLPAIPTNETTEVVSPVLICATPVFVYLFDREIQGFDYQNSAAEFAALSSQEICILLSRFTC